MGEYLNFLDVANVEEFVPRHEQPPIYIPCLRASLTNGHFITFLSSSETIVGQIIRKQDNCQDEIIVCCFLPLYDDSTRRHIIYPSILPQVISHASCLGVVELVNIGKIVRVAIGSDSFTTIKTKGMEKRNQNNGSEYERSSYGTEMYLGRS